MFRKAFLLASTFAAMGAVPAMATVTIYGNQSGNLSFSSPVTNVDFYAYTGDAPNGGPLPNNSSVNGVQFSTQSYSSNFIYTPDFPRYPGVGQAFGSDYLTEGVYGSPFALTFSGQETYVGFDLVALSGQNQASNTATVVVNGTSYLLNESSTGLTHFGIYSSDGFSSLSVDQTNDSNYYTGIGNINYSAGDAPVANVPEPKTLALLGLSFLLMVGLRRRSSLAS